MYVNVACLNNAINRRNPLSYIFLLLFDDMMAVSIREDNNNLQQKIYSTNGTLRQTFQTVEKSYFDKLQAKHLSKKLFDTNHSKKDFRSELLAYEIKTNRK